MPPAAGLLGGRVGILATDGRPERLERGALDALEQLARGRAMQVPAAVLKAGFALGLEAVWSLAQREAEMAAAAANEAGLAEPLVEPDPAKASLGVHYSSPVSWGSQSLREQPC